MGREGLRPREAERVYSSSIASNVSLEPARAYVLSRLAGSCGTYKHKGLASSKGE